MTRFVAAGTRTPFPEQLTILQKIGVLFTGVTVPRPTIHRTPEEAGLHSEKLEITSLDATRLRAWCIPAPGADITVIMFHGYAGNKGDLLDDAVVLHEMGFDLVLVDFRGCGESDGDHTTIGVEEALDVVGTMNAVKSSRPGKKLVLLGQSMGAAAILRAVAFNDIKPDGLVLEAPFDRMLSTVGNRFTAMSLPAFPLAHLLVFWGGKSIGIDGFAHDPAVYARQVQCPAIVLNGDHDRRVSVEQAGHVFEALAGWKRLKVFTGAGHLLYTKSHVIEWKTEVEALLVAVRGQAAGK
jgi:alpha-beta hydrolase superfamily lysophospholipase